MYVKSTLLLTTFVAFAGGAIAAPVTQFAPRSVARATDTVRQSDESGFMLVQNRGRGGGGQRAGGGGGQRAAAGNRGGNFNSNNFHRDASNVNRNANVNASRNVNVNGGGGCCNGNYSTYAAPPPTYPPGYVEPPPY
jgi:hypothetical protein